jgi:hypothetical protein
MLMKNTQYDLKHLIYILRLGAIHILILASLTGSAPAGSSAPIAGCYYQLVTPISVGDSRSHPAYNTLRLTPIGKDRYEFSCDITGGNFHVCGAGGIAVVKKRGKNPVLEVLPDEEQTKDEGEKPCKLKIRFTRNKVVIEDENGTCHEHFGCGARVGFSDAVFLRKGRVPGCSEQP